MIEKLVKDCSDLCDRLHKKLKRRSELVERQRREDEVIAHTCGIPFIEEAACLMVLWFTGKMVRDTYDRSTNASLLAREAGCRLEDVERSFHVVLGNEYARSIHFGCTSHTLKVMEEEAKSSAESFSRHPSLISVLPDQYWVLQHRDIIFKELSRTLCSDSDDE